MTLVPSIVLFEAENQEIIGNFILQLFDFDSEKAKNYIPFQKPSWTMRGSASVSTKVYGWRQKPQKRQNKFP